MFEADRKKVIRMERASDLYIMLDVVGKKLFDSGKRCETVFAGVRCCREKLVWMFDERRDDAVMKGILCYIASVPRNRIPRCH